MCHVMGYHIQRSRHDHGQGEKNEMNTQKTAVAKTLSDQPCPVRMNRDQEGVQDQVYPASKI